METFWNWKFFLLMLAADFLSEVCFKVAKANQQQDWSALPAWWGKSGVGAVTSAIITFINYPLAWANIILPIAAFFWLPWLPVVVTSACAFFVTFFFEFFILKRAPLLPQLLFFYCALLAGLLLFFSR